MRDQGVRTGQMNARENATAHSSSNIPSSAKRHTSILRRKMTKMAKEDRFMDYSVDESGAVKELHVKYLSVSSVLEEVGICT